MLILLIQAYFTIVYSKRGLFMNSQDVKETRKLIIFWIHVSSTLLQTTSPPVSFVLAAPVNESL